MNESPQHLLLADLGPAPTGGPGRRVGDAERAACCNDLSDHFAAGRLRADELELRLDAAVRAVTEMDLRRLVADLPVTTPPPPPPPALPPPPAAVAAAGWSAVTVLALVVFAVCALTAGGLLLVLGAVNPLLFVGACLGGSAAFVGGVSGTVLWNRAHRRWEPTAPR